MIDKKYIWSTIIVIVIILAIVSIFISPSTNTVTTKALKISDIDYESKKQQLGMYQCGVGGVVGAALRRNPNTGTVEGLSLDGYNIPWQPNVEACNALISSTAPDAIKPNVCNNMDTKNPKHWCGQAAAGYKAALNPYINKIVSELPVKGPFNQSELEAVWLNEGCTDTSYLDDAEQKNKWNALLTSQVIQDIKGLSMATDAESIKKCHGN